MSKKNAGVEVQRIVDEENFERAMLGLHHRQTQALEKIARCLSAIEEAFLMLFDSSDKSLRMKDVDRAKVYSTHLGKKLKK